MSELPISSQFIKHLKTQIIQSRYSVARIANAESLKLYFVVGKAIEQEFKDTKWGDKTLKMLSNHLQKELPGLRGFSSSNLKKMRAFYNAWNGDLEIGSTLSTQLEINTQNPHPTPNLSQNRELHFFAISFSHHFDIFTQIKNPTQRWYYIQKSATEYWTVRQLRTELENKSHNKIGAMPNNFDRTLPDTLSNKAIRAFKDQYLLDFVTLEDDDDEIDERVLEQEIVQNIKKFLMSLGTDFTFIGNQYRLIVNEDEYFIDLLFFHRSLQALVAFELKKGKFKPEYVGKMNFYLSALDDNIKQAHENPSIGIILCKEKDDKKVEYSFRDINKPMGVSVFKTSETLPQKYKDALPSPEDLKRLLE